MHHEVVERFSAAGLRLCPTLETMLDEDPSHQTERRGSGFTQASRYLAVRINHLRLPASLDDLEMFRDWKGYLDNHRLRDSLNAGIVRTWRHWHQSLPTLDSQESEQWLTARDLEEESARQVRLRGLVDEMEREESRLLTSMIRDIVLPHAEESEQGSYLPIWPEKLKVGSCPMAEKWFLELAHGFIPRKARCNFLVDKDGRPLLLEKTGMGDDRSCLSLRPLIMNGVRIPVGSLLAVEYGAKALENAPQNPTIPGQQIRIDDCEGFRMLRLTTLSVSGANRRRAFSTHFDSQVAEGLFEPEKTEMRQLQQLAEDAMFGITS